ncbi:MAG TPA: hypothetical protein VFH39_00800 [Candidatus Saccharimonadales bacterium]|nr:hypothetical protein [Candidatus Saccharimonadales bacterium]
MNNSISLLLLLTGSASVVAALPQVVQLMKVKTSRELSLVSWTVWLIYQAVSVAYSVHIKAVAYVVINALWVCFYTAMIVLIIRYRKNSVRTRGRA